MRTKRRRRMTEGSLKLNETPLISRSWTAITSTFFWHQSVIAFCQSTILRGSYEAFRRSACSMARLDFARTFSDCQAACGTKHYVTQRVTPILRSMRSADGAPLHRRMLIVVLLGMVAT